MGTTFNSQILVEKLAKLNNSQQSIETLSHWCIFHMNKAKQVVETWARQFHSSPRDQRVAFLYLANDILQNSRRKGVEFFAEFWKVLPDALRDVIESGDEFGRNAALRLINIWEERKIFGSRGQLLKEGLTGNTNKTAKPPGFKLRQSAGNVLDKIVSEYQNIYGGQVDEDAVIGKCRNAISCIEKVEKEIGGDIRSGKVNGSGIVDELKGQHTILRNCIEQLKAVESSRANLVTYLHQALQEQEMKLDQTRNQLQAAQSRSEQADNYCRQLINSNTAPMLADHQSTKETHTSKPPHSYVSGNGEQSAPVMYTRQLPFSEKSGHIEDDTKSAAAAVAAKLTASTSSAQMLTYVLSSLASEGVLGNNPMKKESSSSDYAPEKRAKINNDYSHSQYVPSPNSQPPVPPFPHPDSLQHNYNGNNAPPPPATSQEMTPSEPPSPPPSPPPPPSSPPPPLPPMPPPMLPYQVPQFMQTAGSVTYTYGPPQPQPPIYPPQMNGVSPFTPPPPPPNTYQMYQVEGGYYSQPSSMPTAPVSRQ